ncbi:MAG: nicotinate-nucleotide adenylyltransferase [Bacteroidales bacterium]|nr:nicotinate-nucleotide adenylyltransferase [Bacteroidales bacterium]
MQRKRHIALMGGSFNPVHAGHLMVADYVRQTEHLDEVLMCVSPLNPFKTAATDLASDTDRMAMMETACNGREGLTPCDIELTMPRPSYTIDTLHRLAGLYPDAYISIIIGSDNWLAFDRWRAADEIINRFGVIVYPRPGYDVDESSLPPNVRLVKAPTIDLSGTFLRRRIADGLDMNLFMPAGVYNYIKSKKLYGTA